MTWKEVDTTTVLDVLEGVEEGAGVDDASALEGWLEGAAVLEGWSSDDDVSAGAVEMGVELSSAVDEGASEELGGGVDEGAELPVPVARFLMPC